MDAIKALSAGFDNVHNMQNARAQSAPPQRERERGLDVAQPSPQAGIVPSTQVDLSDAARAAARSGAPASPPPTAANAPAAPVQTREAIARAAAAERPNNVEARDVAASGVANREAVQRYLGNSTALPVGQSAPSTVRVSA